MQEIKKLRATALMIYSSRTNLRLSSPSRVLPETLPDLVVKETVVVSV